MGISLGTALGIGGSVLGGVLGAKGSKDAAKEARKGQDAATALQREQYYNALALNEPWRATGTGALQNLARLYGLPYQGYTPLSSLTGQPPGQPAPQTNIRGQPKTRLGRFSMPEIADAIRSGADPAQIGQIFQGAPDMSVFTTSPDYEFRRREGMRGVEQGAAARGGALSGNALRALTGYNSDLASTEFGNYFERMSRLAGLGSAATNTAIGSGQNYAANAGNLMNQAGQSRASGVLGQYNAWGNAINNIGGTLGYWWQNRQQAPTGSGGMGRGF